MAYVFQTFVASQVLTAAQMNQVEENIKAHVHGLSGVVAAGLSFTIQNTVGADTVAASDIGNLFLCTGAPYTIDFVSAATLGSGFAAAFKNVDTLAPIYLDAFGSQTIDGRSGYLLCPGESVIITSNGSNLISQGEHDAVWLGRVSLPSSFSSATVDAFAQYVNHFNSIEFQIMNLGASGSPEARVRVSIDSGSTFMNTAGGYDTIGYGAPTNYFPLMSTNITTTNVHIISKLELWPGGTASQPGLTVTTAKKNNSADSASGVVNSGGIVSAFQIYASANAIVGGSIIMYGRGRM